MATSSETLSTRPARTSSPRRWLRHLAVTALLATAGSVLTAQIIGAAGKAAGATHIRQLTPMALGLLTVLGVVAGTVAWSVIGSRLNGARLLTTLVPVVLALSFVPDVALGLTGTAWSGVLTLMLAHVAVFAVTIPILRHRLDPVTPRPA